MATNSIPPLKIQSRRLSIPNWETSVGGKRFGSSFACCRCTGRQDYCTMPPGYQLSTWYRIGQNWWSKHLRPCEQSHLPILCCVWHCTKLLTERCCNRWGGVSHMATLFAGCSEYVSKQKHHQHWHKGAVHYYDNHYGGTPKAKRTTKLGHSMFSVSKIHKFTARQSVDTK